MVIENVVNGSVNGASYLVNEIGALGNWLKAIGLLVVIWLIVQGVTLYYNRKRRITINKIKESLESLEKKVDRLLKK